MSSMTESAISTEWLAFFEKTLEDQPGFLLIL